MRDIVHHPSPPPTWTFLSNHGHVLLCLAGQPGMRLRDVAAQVRITERAVQRIVADLEQAGYLRHRRCGRRNRYEFSAGTHLRHPVESHRTAGELMEFVFGPRTPVPLCQGHLPHDGARIRRNVFQLGRRPQEGGGPPEGRPQKRARKKPKKKAVE